MIAGAADTLGEQTAVSSACVGAAYIPASTHTDDIQETELVLRRSIDSAAKTTLRASVR